MVPSLILLLKNYIKNNYLVSSKGVCNLLILQYKMDTGLNFILLFLTYYSIIKKDSVKIVQSKLNSHLKKLVPQVVNFPNYQHSSTLQ